MNADVIYELVGYAGSGLVVLSLSMTSILRLRLIGLAGATAFLIYGFLISAYPIAATNVVIIAIHAYYLRKLLGSTPVFTMLEVAQGSRYLEYFLQYYAEDIAKYLPDFHYEPKPNRYRAFILRDMVPTGLFMCDLTSDGTAHVLLDYVIPEYRDLKVGKFLHSSDSSIFTDPDIRRVVSPPGSKRHSEYLERLGYRAQTGPDGRVLYELVLADNPNRTPSTVKPG